jgi:hypothetical protein
MFSDSALVAHPDGTRWGPGAADAGCRRPATAGAVAAMPKLLTLQVAPAKPAPPAALRRKISQ